MERGSISVFDRDTLRSHCKFFLSDGCMTSTKNLITAHNHDLLATLMKSASSLLSYSFLAPSSGNISTLNKNNDEQLINDPVFRALRVEKALSLSQ